MSTKNIAHNKNWKFQQQDKSEQSLDNTAFLELSKKLASDIHLRQFFVGNIFTELFNADKGLCEFIKAVQIFPAVYLKKSGHGVIDFFGGMHDNAEDTFEKKLQRTFEDVCSNACDIGIFEPQTDIIGVDGTLHIVNSRQDEVPSTDIYGTFYKVSETLREPWIKAEDHGKMLEAWIQALVEEHLKDKGLEIVKNAEVIETKKLSLEFVAGKRKKEDIEAAEKDIDAAEIDCVIKKDGRSIGFIECKMDKKFGWGDILKFYGCVQLLQAEFGVIVIGHKERFVKDRLYGNVKIFPNILEREEFPGIMFDYIDSKLGIK